MAAGTVHPGKLVRALRRLALAAGRRLHEHTRMTGLDRGLAAPRRARYGGVIDSRQVVLATNAWAAGLRELRSQLLVVSSEIVATEPAPERLASIGWTGGEAICDSQARVLYYQATADGRVVFGRGGGSMVAGRAIPPAARSRQPLDGRRHAGVSPALSAACRRRGAGRLVGADRPLVHPPADVRAPGRPQRHPLRRGLERDGRRAVGAGRPDPRVPRARPGRRVELLGAGGSARVRPVPARADPKR